MTATETAPTGAGASQSRGAGLGVAAALAAYGMWGGFPILFRLLQGSDAALIVSQRVVWSLVFVGIVLALRNRMGEVRVALANRRTLVGMLISALLLSVNWLVFVWAVEAERVLETSFGYFITPLVSVAIGMVFLGERQNRVQALAILIALVAVGLQAVAIGGLPWVSLALAVSFGSYGYFRKTVTVGSTPGLYVETLLMLPAALAYILYVLVTSGPGQMADPLKMFYFILTGPATAMGLIFFAYAAKRLRMTTIGMFQYITPTLQFLVAVFVFGETLTSVRLMSFGLILVSLAVFTGDTVIRRRRPPPVMESVA
ncbi:MAG TPA: EamA family transporter RarD [Devosiaceae bacterium]